MFWGAPLATEVSAPRRVPVRSRARPIALANASARIAGAILLAGFAASCGTSSEVSSGPSPVKCGLRMQADSTGFSPDGGTGTVSITADRECAWSAQSDASWLSLTSATGQGNGSLRFTVAQNGDPSARNARIRVQDQQVEISQRAAACDLHVSSNREAVGPEGGSRTIRVTASSAQCTWTAASSTSWITVGSGSSGQGDGAIELRIPASNGSPRTGTVTIAGKVVTVEQSAEACSVQADPHAFATPAVGGHGSIRIDARQDCRWTAMLDQASRSWVEIAAGASGSGAGEVQFTVRAHDGPARTAHIQIANETVTISQASNCAVSVDPTMLSVGAQQTSQSIRVESAGGCDWSAASSSPWITVSAGASGAGNGRVDLAIAANQGPQRTAAVSIGGQSITVTQAGGCTYTVSPGSLDLPGVGGAAAVTVTTAAECAWTAESNASWIVLTAGATGSGTGRVELTAAPNAGPERSASISIAGQTVSVKQATGSPYAESGAPWIRMTVGESGAGDGHIEFVVEPNTGAIGMGHGRGGAGNGDAGGAVVVDRVCRAGLRSGPSVRLTTANCWRAGLQPGRNPRTANPRTANPRTPTPNREP
jgi:hypothetical protein